MSDQTHASTTPATPPTADQLRAYFNELLDEGRRHSDQHHHVAALHDAFKAGRITFT